MNKPRAARPNPSPEHCFCGLLLGHSANHDSATRFVVTRDEAGEPILSPVDRVILGLPLESEIGTADDVAEENSRDDERDHETGRCGGLAYGCSACGATADAQDGRL